MTNGSRQQDEGGSAGWKQASAGWKEAVQDGKRAVMDNTVQTNANQPDFNKQSRYVPDVQGIYIHDKGCRSSVRTLAREAEIVSGSERRDSVVQTPPAINDGASLPRSCQYVRIPPALVRFCGI